VTLNEEKAAKRLLHDQLTAELKTLDNKEENLLDLAADDALPKTKIKSRLRDIEHRRRHLTERLSQTTEELSEAAHLIEIALALLEDPQALYLRSSDEQRRMLNQAIFHALYVQDDAISGHDLKEPFASLHTLQNTRRDTPPPTAPSDTAAQAPGQPSPRPETPAGPNTNRPLPQREERSAQALDALLADGPFGQRF
jgi:site-specific DNA recombinase